MQLLKMEYKSKEEKVMAKFCTQCGKRLEEGEVCSCRQQAAFQQMAVQTDPTVDQQTAPDISQQTGMSMDRQMNSNGNQPSDSNTNQQMSPYMEQQYQQMPPNMNQPYQQGMPNRNQPYQQVPPNMNGPYQPGMPNRNQQYQQVPPNMNQSYQPGMPNMNQPYYQVPPNVGQYQQYQRRVQRMQGADVAAEAKNILQKGFEILKRPVTAAKQFTNPDTLMGIEIISVKAVLETLILLFITVIAVGKIEDMSYGYVKIDVPYFRIILLSLILTAGVDFLDALLLKVLSGDRSLTFKSMTVNVSVRVVYGLIGTIVGGLFLMLGVAAEVEFFLVLAVLAVCAVSLIVPYAQFAAYIGVVNSNENGKVFRYVLAKVILAIVLMLVVMILGESVISDLQSALRYSSWY